MTRAFTALGARPNTVLISTGATSPTLTPLDNSMPTDERPGLLWRTVPPDTLQSQVIVSDLRSRMVHRVAVVHQTGPYGEALAQLVAQQYTDIGVTVRLIPFNTGQLTSVIASVGAANDEELLLISSAILDYVAFVNGATATPALMAQYNSKRLFFTDGGYDQVILDMATANARTLFPNVHGTRPAPSTGTPLYENFEADFMLQYAHSAAGAGYTAHSYDAGWLAIYGAAWSIARDGGAVTALGVARGLRHISAGRAIQIRAIDWASAVNAFETNMTIDVTGASGALDYNPATEETTAPIEVWRLMMTGATWSYVRDRVVQP